MTSTKPKIIICDDSRGIREITSQILELEGFETRQAASARECFEMLEREPLPDMLLLDVEMPEENGYMLCRRIRETFPHANLPILFFTSYSDQEHERLGFEAGANDFIAKPVYPQTLLARTWTHVRAKQHRDHLENHQKILAGEVATKTRALVALQKVTIFALTSLCGERDQETGSHILRTQLYALHLAQKYQTQFPSLTNESIEAIYRYAPLHDIGKIGIPDRILLKPGRLTPVEFDIIKNHTLIGYRALEGAEALISQELPELETAKNLIKSHHEKWNGSGYPEGLSGQQIPIEARIMAVADVYDAIRSKRVYKEAKSHEEAVEIFLSERGNHFDPDLVDAFHEINPLFANIARQYEATEEEEALTQQKVTLARQL